MSQRNIVVLGASYAGLSTAHYFLRHVLHTLPTDDGMKYTVYLISPSSHFFHRFAGPRAVISDSALQQEKYLVPIADGFKQYPADTFAFVEGAATAVDIAARTVTYTLTQSTASTATLPYHALVIATGFSTPLRAWSNEGDVSEIRAQLSSLHNSLPAAKTVVIGGGGPAGVETAGEIGEFLNGAAGWFSSRPANPKAKVVLYQADSKLLPILRPALAKNAERLLNRVGVDVIYDTKIVSHSEAEDGTTVLTLSSGETVQCDVYIPATGGIPNTAFLPRDVLDNRGRVKTNAASLRADAAGPRVYAVGDVGSHTRGGVLALWDQIPVLLTNMRRDLQAASLASDEKLNTQGEDRIYKDNLTESQWVPVGRSKGVGAMYGWRVPSWLVWLGKGRDYMVWLAPKLIDGKKWKSES